MSKKTTYALLCLAVLALTGVAAFWYFSPYLAVYEMRHAASDKNADAFNNYVDYPKLRESFRSQLTPTIEKEVAASSLKLGPSFAKTLITQMTDAYLQPEVVMQLMAQGRVNAKPKEAASVEDASSPDVKWDFSRESVDKMVANGQLLGTKTERASLVFEREGFFQWKLTEVRLPSPN